MGAVRRKAKPAKPAPKTAPKPRLVKPLARITEELEPCAGCGAVAYGHPIVGVTKDQETGQWEAFPVCDLCWRDPSHRVHPLKMHFFPASQAKEAVAKAGSSTIG